MSAAKTERASLAAGIIKPAAPSAATIADLIARARSWLDARVTDNPEPPEAGLLVAELTAALVAQSVKSRLGLIKLSALRYGVVRVGSRCEIWRLMDPTRMHEAGAPILDLSGSIGFELVHGPVPWASAIAQLAEEMADERALLARLEGGAR